MRLRQPLIVAFIAVGILVGPAGFGWVGESTPIELFAELGIALLLFVVGLKLDPHMIRAVGPVALVVGIIQILLTGGLGFLLARGLGFSAVAAVYLALALSFSSTIAIVKLLSDKREIAALLEAAGADLVLLPFRDAAIEAARLLSAQPLEPAAATQPAGGQNATDKPE